MRHVDVELQRLLRDVADHVIRISERADGFRILLQNALANRAFVKMNGLGNEIVVQPARLVVVLRSDRAAIEKLGVSPLHRMSFQSLAYQQLSL